MGDHGWMNPGGYRFEHHAGPGAIGWTIFALQLVLVLGLAALLLRAFAARPWRGPEAADPLGVLRLRYARGEITREEFLQASGDLG